MDSIIIRYDEIGLKGKNRIDFERILIRNIKTNLDMNKKSFDRVDRKYGRMIIKTEARCDCLKDVFGIASFSHATEVAQDMDIMKKEVLIQAKELGISKDNTFCMRVQRIDKKYPGNSMEMAAEFGSDVVEETGVKVKLKDPDHIIYLELIDGKAYVFSEKIEASGGLPVGSSGKVVCLLSTGIDSPVAAWMIMKRGCSTVMVFNYNHPFAGKKEKEYAIDQLRNLQRFDSSAKMYIVPFGKVHQAIKDGANPKLFCVLCKRYMYKVANIIAEKERAKAVVTGESVGQVASQTIENLFVLDKASDLPVLRPVIGMNKQEVISIAKNIGTYEPSIRTHGKCGLLPTSPATRSKIEIVEREERRVMSDEDLVLVIDQSEIVE